jgi:hypothetical protein
MTATASSTAERRELQAAAAYLSSVTEGHSPEAAKGTVPFLLIQKSGQSPLDVLQEFSDNRGVALRVDRSSGVIQGVKLLGTLSKKGREYPVSVIAKAAPMYEGMRVNIDHVDPGQRRSLRDRIGIVKNVAVKEDGLYGDFHFNPKHALAEQIAWDAENAPQNLGFSHDTRGVVRSLGGRAVVESIEKVLSVDLVANPATTDGLFEDAVSAGRIKGESRDDVSRLTLDDLRSRRPDLVDAMQESLDRGDELRRLREALHSLRTEQAARQLDDTIAAQLKAAGLDPANRVHCSEVFLEDLRGTADAARRQAKIDDRRALVVAARPSPAAPTTGSVSMLEALDTLPAAAPLADRVRNWTR